MEIVNELFNVTDSVTKLGRIVDVLLLGEVVRVDQVLNDVFETNANDNVL